MKQPRVLPPLVAAIVFMALTSVAWTAWAQSASEADDRIEITKELQTLLGDVREQQRLIIQKLEGIEERLRQLEGSGDGPVAVDSEPSGGAEEPPDPATAEKQPESNRPSLSEGEVAQATVCRQGRPFTDLNAAIEAAEDGDTITVAPGLYGMCAVIKKSLHLLGLRDDTGKRAHLGGGVCEGKGPLVVRAPKVTIEGFEISNVSVRDKNGACVRVGPTTEDVTIRDIYCHDSENGILANLGDGVITIEDSRFERNGANNGYAHGVYISQAKSLVVRNTQILSTKGAGQSLKSGIPKPGSVQ